MSKKKNIRDFDPIESKRNKRKPDPKLDPSRKNKKYFLQYSNDYK